MRRSVSPPVVFEPSDILTVEQLAARLQVKRYWLYKQTKRGYRKHNTNPLPFFKMGRYLRFRWSEVCQWLESKRVGKVA